MHLFIIKKKLIQNLKLKQNHKKKLLKGTQEGLKIKIVFTIN